MKKFFAFLICVVFLFGAITPVSYADDGKIDLYQAFSNKDDQSKTEVGSRIYKWSMYLPDDAIIYKSERVNYFNMSTTSYQATADLEVNKNVNNQTLEDILYSLQNQSKQGYYWLWGDKEFQVDIAKDEWGQKYIRIIKAGGYYDYYLVDKAAEEFSEYIENRIYISNNYVYNLTIHMNGDFYKQHEELFDKLASSFKLSFDEKNPNIKELSDSISTAREYKNTSYGWKMVLSPYWKMEGSPNARNQIFRPVYSDEELNQDKAAVDETENGFKVPEGITVSLIGSSSVGENATQWALKDIDKIKDNYNKEVCEIITCKEYAQAGLNVYNVSVRFKTVTKKPYIMNNLYVVGNGYKYLISAVMMEDEYLNNAKKDSFNNMLKTFELDKTCLSKYLGKIVQADDIVNMNEAKDLKMKKYNFTTKITRNWNVSNSMGTYGMYNDMYMEKMYYYESISNNEFLSAFEPESNINLSMTAGLNSNTIDEIIAQRTENLLNDDEIRLQLAKVNIESTESNGAVIYCISKEYDTKAIEKFVDEDKTKNYSFDTLTNQYEYIIKLGKDIYIQDIMIPVSNTSDVNLKKVKDIWSDTTVNNVNYSNLDLKWKKHTLQEFDKQKK
jgi:hypothetical protein